MKQPEVQENLTQIDYNPVPNKSSFRVYLRAKFKGRGKPLPYILDEEEKNEPK